jgi:hypothetical protein
MTEPEPRETAPLEPPPVVRRPYQPPQLKRLGTIQELTQTQPGNMPMDNDNFSPGSTL